jgi:hypothetical protein
LEDAVELDGVLDATHALMEVTQELIEKARKRRHTDATSSQDITADLRLNLHGTRPSDGKHSSPALGAYMYMKTGLLEIQHALMRKVVKMFMDPSTKARVISERLMEESGEEDVCVTRDCE